MKRKMQIFCSKVKVGVLRRRNRQRFCSKLNVEVLRRRSVERYPSLRRACIVNIMLISHHIMRLKLCCWFSLNYSGLYMYDLILIYF